MPARKKQLSKTIIGLII